MSGMFIEQNQFSSSPVFMSGERWDTETSWRSSPRHQLLQTLPASRRIY